MVLTLEPAALSRSKGSPERPGRALGHRSWEWHLLVTVIGCAVLPAIKGSGCHLVLMICGPAFLTRDG